MKKILLTISFAMPALFFTLNVKSQLLYQNNIYGAPAYNPGLGANNTPVILFDDINFASSITGEADSVVINQIKVAINRAAGAPAVIVKVYATSSDPVSPDSLPAVPPKLVGTTNLPAGGTSTIFTIGDGIAPLFTFVKDTGRIFSGYQTLFVGLSFSDSTSSNGWYFTNGPDFNYDLAFKYDQTNLTAPRTKLNFSGSSNLPATFYAEVYGTVKFASPLPVTLNDLNITKQGNKNVITWKTSTENNSSHFIIERSTDGRSFKEIGKTEAAGLSNSTLDYLFSDNAPVKGTNHYRINAINKDSTGKYSPIKSIRNSGSISYNLYPNPVVNTIKVLIDADEPGNAIVLVTDIAGKCVHSRFIKIYSGKNIFNIDMINTAKGTYVVKVQLNGCAFIKKIIRK